MTIQILELKCTKSIFHPTILCSNIFNTIYTVLLYTFFIITVHTQYVEQYPLMIINIKNPLPFIQTKMLASCPNAAQCSRSTFLAKKAFRDVDRKYDFLPPSFHLIPKHAHWRRQKKTEDLQNGNKRPKPSDAHKMKLYMV